MRAIRSAASIGYRRTVEIPDGNEGGGSLKRLIGHANVPLSLLAIAVFVASVSLGGAAASAEAPKPAGTSPSSIARMVCQTKASGEIAQVLGVKAAVSAPTWTYHLYSCGYRYKTGTMVLSVKELSSWTQTYAYFDKLAKTLHKTIPIHGLGQGAFRVRDGSIVVRKDWKILLVDTSGLQRRVGSPPSTQSEVALDAAAVILGCWNGD